MSALRTRSILVPPVPPPPPSSSSSSFSSSRSPRTLSLLSLRLGLATWFIAPRRSRTQGAGPNSEPAMSDSNSSAQSVPIGVDYAEIVVVRHGETEWNADGRIQGHLDVELNEIGRQQATAVGERLSREGKISAIYSSDLKRAFETANLIATACGGLEVIKDSDLRERNLGDLQGLQLRAAASVSPEAYKAFLSHKTDQEIPGGGESIDQLYRRCTACLQNISVKHKGERIVVVTHGGVIRSLNRRACPNKRSGRKVLNTSVNIFHLSDGDNWVLKSWGDVSHLSQTEHLSTGFGGDRTSG
ncbi:phosphoglycerate mutase-like protein 4 isoform X3 [Rhodamnia argentea]|uniref:Phosphoglycerate mutase-like protein 4 isoform X3 n=1 Tax=Rhodamnia argentea TaxID=178133 RepID=A0A8B8PVJ3_9MYRT|nr:phosphoglycerate mutase-like protein 4 isoform X3 [Rhodamnia argentea]